MNANHHFHLPPHRIALALIGALLLLSIFWERLSTQLQFTVTLCFGLCLIALLWLKRMPS